MKKFYDKVYKSLYPYLFSEDLPFDTRVLNTLCVTGFIATLLSMIGHRIEGTTWQIWVLKVVMLVSIAGLFWITNRFKIFELGKIVALVSFSDVVFPLVFIWNGGFASGTSAYFVVTIIIIVLLSHGWIRVLMMLIHFAVLGVCYYINWNYPWMIIQLSDMQQFIDSMVTFLIAGSLLGLVIVIMQHMNLLERQRAEKAGRAKGDFLAQMSHEMRTPMNAIIGMSAIAKRTDDPERMKDSIRKIEMASEHLLGVINDILDMSKIEAGKLELDDSDFDFYDMIEQTIQINNFRIEEKMQRFIIRVDKKIPRYFRGDGQRLSQVITNLLSNAVKFTPPSGTIRFVMKVIDEADGVYTLRGVVADTGIGIAEEQKQRLFHSFEQADNTISRKYGGTGLGLSISKKIVELMGGDIEVDSVVGEGSAFTFTVKLPRSDPGHASDIPRHDHSARVPKPGYLQGNKILLAEDVEINREVVISLLEDTGVEIDCAENGKLAVEMFTTDPSAYKLIFMDIQMPEMDGYEATRTIRSLPLRQAKTIPIVAMTANVFKEDVERSMEAGMNGHLGKPLMRDDVIAILDRYLVNGENGGAGKLH